MIKFLQLASASSLWRGMDYFKENRVQSFSPTVVGYDGIIIGSDLYHASIDIAHPRRSTCDCPFAKGHRVICKHMVALLFTAEPEQADALQNEAKDWERQAEEEWEAKCAEIRKDVMSMTKKELQETLIRRMIWEEQEKRDRWMNGW